MVYKDNYIYHVFNRGAHKQIIHPTDFHYTYCLELLDKYRSPYCVSILAYCLMPNHFHLMLQQREGGSISRFIQTTFNAYVQAYNRMENHCGTIFEGSAKKILVESDEYAVQLVAYIHENPVVAGLVVNPEEWKFSDCREWIGDVPFRFAGKTLFENYFSNAGEYINVLKDYHHVKTEQLIGKYLLDGV
jgi:putative transposase